MDPLFTPASPEQQAFYTLCLRSGGAALSWSTYLEDALNGRVPQALPKARVAVFRRVWTDALQGVRDTLAPKGCRAAARVFLFRFSSEQGPLYPTEEQVVWLRSLRPIFDAAEQGQPFTAEQLDRADMLLAICQMISQGQLDAQRYHEARNAAQKRAII